MTHYIIVKIEGAYNSNVMPYVDEILSNLESVVNGQDTPINGNILVRSLKGFAEDLQTLQRSTVDQTDLIECTAALNNFTSGLLAKLDIAEPLGQAMVDGMNLWLKSGRKSHTYRELAYSQRYENGRVINSRY